MKCPTQIEQDLFDYPSLTKQAEVEKYLVSVDEFPNECLHCGVRIKESDDFCSEKCRNQYETIEAQDLMAREEPVLELDEDRLRDEENERRTI